MKMDKRDGSCFRNVLAGGIPKLKRCARTDPWFKEFKPEWRASIRVFRIRRMYKRMHVSKAARCLLRQWRNFHPARLLELVSFTLVPFVKSADAVSGSALRVWLARIAPTRRYIGDRCARSSPLESRVRTVEKEQSANKATSASNAPTETCRPTCRFGGSGTRRMKSQDRRPPSLMEFHERVKISE